MKKPADLAYGVDERPPRSVLWLTALQHVGVLALVMVFPLLVSRAAGASPTVAAQILSAGMLALGLATIAQARTYGPIGSGYLAPTGFQAVYLGPSLVAAQAGGLPLVFGMTIFSGLVEATLSRVWRPLRAYLPPELSGLVVLFTGLGEGYDRDISYVDLREGSAVVPFLDATTFDQHPRFAPSGDFVSYTSSESGMDEIYLTTFPSREGKWQVSVGGGTLPRWSPRGDYLYYFSGNDLMQVAVRTDPTVVVGTPERLFTYIYPRVVTPGTFIGGYDVAPDGERWLFVKNVNPIEAQPVMRVVQNWFAEFDQ